MKSNPGTAASARALADLQNLIAELSPVEINYERSERCVEGGLLESLYQQTTRPFTIFY
jgi:hypothetical protein